MQSIEIFLVQITCSLILPLHSLGRMNRVVAPLFTVRAETKHFAVELVKQRLVKSFRLIIFDRNTKAVGINIVNHNIIILSKDADDVGSFILLAINPVIFHMRVFIQPADSSSLWRQAINSIPAIEGSMAGL